MTTVDQLLNEEPLVSAEEKSASFETIHDARKWIPTIIIALTDLKSAPGGGLPYRNLLKRIVEPFKGKGSGNFKEEIDDLVSYEENKRRNERLHEATDNKENLNIGPNGTATATLENVLKVLLQNKFMILRHDVFMNRKLLKFIGQPLWHEGLPEHKFEMKYTDSEVETWYFVEGHSPEIKLYLSQFFPEERNWRELPDAIAIVAERNQINIYQRWMEHLPKWDGVDRFDFLNRHAGATDKEWAIVVGKSIFLPMLARCYEPGFDFRGFPILEGAENIGKSRLVRALAFDERFTTHFIVSKNGGEYEPARQLRSQVIVELPDKGGIDSKTPDQIKAFLTLVHDINRGMNKNNVEHIKRIGTFVITCNEIGAYLKGGVDGDTRLLPIRLNGKINVEAIQSELPQLYAQAKHLWDSGVKPWLTENDLALQRKQVEPRQIKSNYYYWMLDILKLHRNQMTHEWDDGFTMDEMLGWCENESWFPLKNKTHHRREIANVLQSYFCIESIVRMVPVQYQVEGKSKTRRKWRYDPIKKQIDWNTFIDSLED